MADGTVCIKCDSCGDSFHGESFDKVAQIYRPRGHGIFGANTLRAEALANGWTGPMTRESNSDKCPKCSQAGEKP